MSVAVRVAQNIPKNATPLLLAAATFSSVQVYYSEKAHSQGRVPKLPKPAVKLPIVIPRNKFSYRRLLRVIKRLIEVVASLFPIVVSYLLKSTPIGETREQWLKRLVQTLANLGPVGIKWGQWASTRYDLFEDDVCESLGELTNSAPMHSYETTKEMIEQSFGKALSDLFSEFESVAIASGSIAQVHIATLNGNKVAVKVQHPNLTERLDIDMEVLRWVADFAGDRVRETVDQFSSNFQAQLDFRDEAKNLDTFNLRFSGMFWNSLVSFPKPIKGYISEKVLVETFEEGESVAHFLGRIDTNEDNGGKDNVKTLEKSNNNSTSGKYGDTHLTQEQKDLLIRRQVAQCGMQAFLKMLIWDNFIHADLHPGNVIIRLVEVSPAVRFVRWVLLNDSDPIVPHIVLLDAGLAASFSDKISSQVHMFFKAIANRDHEGIARTILTLNAENQPITTDPEVFVKEVSTKFKIQIEAFEKDENDVRSADNIKSIMQSVRDHHIVVDPAVMIALMSMVVLEGWQYRLAPEISVLNSIENAMGGSVFGMINTVSERLSSFKAQIETHIP